MSAALYLTPAGTYDRAAIMSAAWRLARHEVTVAARSIGYIKGTVTTARAEFPAALRRVWANARSERSYATWAAAQDAGAAAKAARLAALPIRARQIEAASYALLLAEHNDTAGSHRLVAAAHAQLAALSHHA